MDTRRPLTARQKEVLELWLDDVPYKTLATTLGISPETVNPHLKAIAKKLGAAGISRVVLRDAWISHTDPARVEDPVLA